MTAIVIKRTFDDEQFRQDVMNSINLLLLQGHLPKGTEYALGNIRHPNHVILWLRNPMKASEYIIAPKAFDPVDIITGASLNIKLIRGIEGFNGEKL